MFDRLKTKWKVGGLQLTLILCTFAIGGSLTGYAARKLMPVFAIDQRWLWIIVYIILVTLLWPLAVLIVSFPFGQLKFFINYLKKIGRRVGLGKRQKLIKIAVFASGNGSNAQKIIDYFRNSGKVKVAIIACNKPHAGVIKIAEKERIPVLMINKDKFFRGDAYTNELVKQRINFIILAGFLWKIPSLLLKTYQNRVINIHPALLPKYGGKGMYGNFVHQAVLNARDKQSGITIHYVDEVYDHGATIFQASCDVYENDTPESLAARIHQLEHKHYPEEIDKLLQESQ